jgi:hypothetical protein
VIHWSFWWSIWNTRRGEVTWFVWDISLFYWDA